MSRGGKGDGRPLWARDQASVWVREDPTLDVEALGGELVAEHARTHDLGLATQAVAIRHGLSSSGKFEFRPDELVSWGPAGISHLRVKRRSKGKEDEIETRVIADGLRVVRRVVVEREVYVEVEILPGERVTDTVPGILSRLDRMGRVLSHYLARDVLPALLYHLVPKPELAMPTWGFYADHSGAIAESRRPTPVRPEQERAWSEVRSHITNPLTGEGLQSYIDLLGFYRHHESWILLGSAVAAPLAYVARCERELVCHVTIWSKRPGLGKTTLAEALSQDLFGREAVSGSSLNSEFRHAAHIDAYCGPQAINEVQGLNWSRLGPDLKASAESAQATRRGLPEQGMNDFKSREVILGSSNASPPLAAQDLVRFCVIHSDESAKEERQRHAAEFEEAASRVRGHRFGAAISRLIPERYPTVPQFMARRSELAKEIREAASSVGLSFSDGRRAGAFAHIYIGLEAFGLACCRFDVEWQLPTVLEFIQEAVIPTETGASELELGPLEWFRSYLAMWRVEHTVRKMQIYEREGDVQETDSVKGEGSVVWADAFDLGAAPAVKTSKRIAGDWVRLPLLDRYNVECDRRSRPEMRFGSLKELSEVAAREAGLPSTTFLRFDKLTGRWKAEQPYFPDGSRQSAAFVPREDAWAGGLSDGRAVGGGGDPRSPDAEAAVEGRSSDDRATVTAESLEVTSGHQRSPTGDELGDQRPPWSPTVTAEVTNRSTDEEKGPRRGVGDSVTESEADERYSGGP